VLDQLKLIRLRNTSPAFTGKLQVVQAGAHNLHLVWQHPEAAATLRADLRTHAFTVTVDDGTGESVYMSHDPGTRGIATGHVPDTGATITTTGMEHEDTRDGPGPYPAPER
jgi:hypothetical protein